MIKPLELSVDELTGELSGIDNKQHLELFEHSHKHRLPAERKQIAKQSANAIERITTVSHEIIQKRLNSSELQAAITVLTPEFAQWMPTICHKSGRQLKDRYTIEEIGRLISTHGEKRALSIMQLTYSHNTAPEWYFTDFEGLLALSKQDPKGYCITALGIIMEPYWQMQFKKSNIDLEQKCQIIADKAQARQNLQYVDDNLIIELNELLRRFLGICKPEYAVQYLAMACNNMQSMVNTNESIRQIIESIKTALKDIILNHARNHKRKKLNASLMADIKAELRGMSTYYNQLKLGALVNHEANVLDIRGFFSETSNIRIQSMAIKSREIAQAAPEFKTIDASKPIVIQPVEAKTKDKKQNAFSSMFSKGVKDNG